MCWLAAQYIRFVRATSRWRIENGEPVNDLVAAGRPIIVVTWHGRLLMTPHGWRHSNKLIVLASGHRDGQLIGRTLGHFGVRNVTIQYRSSGATAMRQLNRILCKGGVIGIAPDGPRGPRMRAKAGTIHLARYSGAVIIPCTYSATPSRIAGSWDRFIVPLPFCRGLFLWGTPIEVPRDADDAMLEEKRRELENRLLELTHRADAIMGLPRIEPAAQDAPHRA